MTSQNQDQGEESQPTYLQHARGIFYWWAELDHRNEKPIFTFPSSNHGQLAYAVRYSLKEITISPKIQVEFDRFTYNHEDSRGLIWLPALDIIRAGVEEGLIYPASENYVVLSSIAQYARSVSEQESYRSFVEKTLEGLTLPLSQISSNHKSRKSRARHSQDLHKS